MICNALPIVFFHSFYRICCIQMDGSRIGRCPKPESWLLRCNSSFQTHVRKELWFIVEKNKQKLQQTLNRMSTRNRTSRCCQASNSFVLHCSAQLGVLVPGQISKQRVSSCQFHHSQQGNLSWDNPSTSHILAQPKDTHFLSLSHKETNFWNSSFGLAGKATCTCRSLSSLCAFAAFSWREREYIQVPWISSVQGKSCSASQRRLRSRRARVNRIPGISKADSNSFPVRVRASSLGLRDNLLSGEK